YERTLAAIARAPEARYDGAALLAEPERHQLLVEWNDTAAGEAEALDGFVSASSEGFAGSEGTVHALVAARAAAEPTATAIAWDGGSLAYGELAARANRLARHLLRIGAVARPEGVVGVLAGRGPEPLVALLAVLEAGGVYLPLDPSYPDERLAYVIADAGAAAVLATEDLQPRLPATVRVVPLTAALSHSSTESADAPPVPVSPDRLAYAIYTSGSTGRPKGIGLPHRTLANLVAWQIAASPQTAR